MAPAVGGGFGGEQAVLRDRGSTGRARPHGSHRLAVSHAFHSPLMEPMLDRVRGGRWPDCVGASRGFAMVSNVTGELAVTGFGSAQYWVAACPPAGAVRRRLCAALESAGVTAILRSRSQRWVDRGDRAHRCPTPRLGAVSVLGRRTALEAASLFSAVGAVVRHRCGGGLGVRCLGGVVRVGWSCRRMPLSGSGFGCRGWAGFGGCGGVGFGGGREHALLGAVVEWPESGGVVLTGRLSVAFAAVVGRSCGGGGGVVAGGGVCGVGVACR